MSTLKAKPYLREVRLDRTKVDNPHAYPFSIPAIKALETLEFHEDVTFFVGENGSGKSTLLEAIAISLRINPEGGTRSSTFETKRTHSSLSDYIKISRSYKSPESYYFLRAESFYNLATLMDQTGYLAQYGGRSLHEQSHGESFMAVLTSKLQGSGLYLMDEPEAALSPLRQMAALAAIHQLVKKGAQFIIATHSPIILAYPNAKIFQLKDGEIEVVTYEESETYLHMNSFLSRHKDMLRQLMNE